jgi:hypothetical protein
MNGERGLTTETLDRLAGTLGLKLVETRRGRSLATRAEAENVPEA